jgi:hypothetical protein
MSIGGDVLLVLIIFGWIALCIAALLADRGGTGNA